MTIARHTTEATLSGQYLMQLLLALQALGLSSDAVLAGTPIQLESLNADQHLPWSQCLQLMRNAQALCWRSKWGVY